MANRENSRYIVLANVNGKKIAIQLDGLYTILPPQNFPERLPKEIQYKEERLPLYEANEILEIFNQKGSESGSYEKLYRELLSKIKEVTDHLNSLKQNITTSIEHDLAKITQEKIPTATGQVSSILTDTEQAANNIMDLTEKVQEGQNRMAEKFNTVKSSLESIQREEAKLLEHFDELEKITMENDYGLTEIMTALSFQDLTGQKLQKLAGLQEDMEDNLLKILVNFGIKLRKEENPDDETIKRGEEMLNLLQGDSKEAINQNEVDQLLAEFLQ